MIKSPLRYPGGKSRLVKELAKIVPDFDAYREPFVGGGSVFMFLRQEFPKGGFWINDTYSELVAFWRQSQTRMDELVSQVLVWKDDYHKGKLLFEYLKENREDFNDLETAAMFFILNRITFSGTTESGGYSEQAFQKRFTNSSIERLQKLAGILDRVKITNLDYEKLLRAEGSNVFIYLDPPYSHNRSSALYGKHGSLHKNFDHERLAGALKICKHKWLLSYDNSKYIKELYDFAEARERTLVYGMKNISPTSKQRQKELIISNYLTN